MESSGLGLLPGVVLALALILTVMAALLTESMWAVAGVLFVILLCVAALVFVVLAVSAEGDEGRRMRRWVPGLGDED
jgi:hypothetical protein